MSAGQSGNGLGSFSWWPFQPFFLPVCTIFLFFSCRSDPLRLCMFYLSIYLSLSLSLSMCSDGHNVPTSSKLHNTRSRHDRGYGGPHYLLVFTCGWPCTSNLGFFCRLSKIYFSMSKICSLCASDTGRSRLRSLGTTSHFDWLSVFIRHLCYPLQVSILPCPLPLLLRARAPSCSFSWNVYFLIAFRLALGIGISAAGIVGMLSSFHVLFEVYVSIFDLPLSLSLSRRVCGVTRKIGFGSVADVYPPEIRGFAMGWYSVTVLLGPIIGPIIGGILVISCLWPVCANFR